MAERERSHTRPLGGVFVAHSQVLTAADVQRALTRMSHEVVERNGGVDDVVLVGLQTGGVPLATTMAEILRADRGADRAVGTLDVAFYRDDIGLRPVLPEAVTDIPVDLAGRVVVLVDDVLFTGRTIRAALNALNDFGRARAVQLAVMVDRGHRELPIRPDYVGKNLPTRREEMVDVGDDGVWIGTSGGAGDRDPSTCSRSPTWDRDGIAEVLRVAEAFAEVERRAVPKVPTLRGKVGGHALLRGVDPHPALLRDGGQAALGRRALAGRRQLVGQEGRVACATPSRRSRRWASTPSSSATPRRARRTRWPVGRRGPA